jgi:conjugal transfer pilus assembly protein TraV
MNTRYRLALLTLCLGMTGCTVFDAVSGSNEFGCAGMPEGVQCMSAREVYQATEHTDTVTGSRQSKDKPPTAPGGAGTTVVASPRPAPALAVSNPLPIRTQAQVMRVWIAPWEDGTGNLHSTSFIFTEIEPRRWQLGMAATEPEVTLRPLQVVQRDQEQPKGDKLTLNERSPRVQRRNP